MPQRTRNEEDLKFYYNIWWTKTLHLQCVLKDLQLLQSNFSSKMKLVLVTCMWKIQFNLNLYNKAQFMFVCVSASALAIFMDRFSNQGYLWTPHDLGMTRKNFFFQFFEILKFHIFLVILGSWGVHRYPWFQNRSINMARAEAHIHTRKHTMRFIT